MPVFHSVYILQSIPHPAHFYTGLTDNLSTRLAKHNEGSNQSTAAARPWTEIARRPRLRPKSLLIAALQKGPGPPRARYPYGRTQYLHRLARQLLRSAFMLPEF